MVVTNRLWDSVNGFRFQNVILVFHDGFCAVFEDSVKEFRLFGVSHREDIRVNSPFSRDFLPICKRGGGWCPFHCRTISVHGHVTTAKWITEERIKVAKRLEHGYWDILMAATCCRNSWIKVCQLKKIHYSRSERAHIMDEVTYGYL